MYIGSSVVYFDLSVVMNVLSSEVINSGAYWWIFLHYFYKFSANLKLLEKNIGKKYPAQYKSGLLCHTPQG